MTRHSRHLQTVTHRRTGQELETRHTHAKDNTPLHPGASARVEKKKGSNDKMSGPYHLANFRGNTSAVRRALHHGSRKLVIVSAFVACSAPRGSGFLPPTARQHTSSAGQQHGIDRRRWSSAATHHPLPSSGGGRVPGAEQDAAASRNYSTRRRRRRRERVSMAGAGNSERQGPGKGTQVVLLRHGMSTFNKLNIFTVSVKKRDKARVCHGKYVSVRAKGRQNAPTCFRARLLWKWPCSVGMWHASDTQPKANVTRHSLQPDCARTAVVVVDDSIVACFIALLLSTRILHFRFG